MLRDATKSAKRQESSRRGAPQLIGHGERKLPPAKAGPGNWLAIRAGTKDD